MFKKIKLLVLTILLTFIFSSTVMATHNQIKESENVICKVVGLSDGGDVLNCLTEQNKRLEIRLTSIKTHEEKTDLAQITWITLNVMLIIGFTLLLITFYKYYTARKNEKVG